MQASLHLTPLQPCASCPLLPARHRRSLSLRVGTARLVQTRAGAILGDVQESATEQSSAIPEDAQEELSLPPQHTLESTSKRVLDRTRTSGLVLTAYIFVAASPQAGACCAVGAACSWAYLSLIVREIEQLPNTYESPMLAAKETENWFLQKLAMWATSYRHSLKPRLMIPVGLVLAFVAYNHIADRSHRLGYVEISCLAAGFLASKGAMVREVWDSNQERHTDVEERPHIDLY